MVLVAAVAYVIVSYVIVAPLQQLYRGDRAWSVDALREYVPSLVLNIALTVAGAGIYVEDGLSGIAFALLAVLAFCVHDSSARAVASPH